MKVVADISIVPIGVGVSVSKYVAKCQQIFEQRGLSYQLHGYGTNLEGEWDEVFSAIQECHEVIHKMGAPRITSSMRFGTRIDRDQSFQDKIDSVSKKLES